MNPHLGVHQFRIVHPVFLNRDGGEGTVTDHHSNGHIRAGLDDRMHELLDLYPLRVLHSRQQMGQAHSRSFGRYMRFADDANAWPSDHRPEISRAAHAGQIDERARVNGKDGSGRDGDKDGSSRILHKQCAVPGIDVRIVVGDYSQQVNRVMAPGFLWGQAMDALRGGDVYKRQGFGPSSE